MAAYGSRVSEIRDSFACWPKRVGRLETFFLPMPSQALGTKYNRSIDKLSHSVAGHVALIYLRLEVSAYLSIKRHCNKIYIVAGRAISMHSGHSPPTQTMPTDIALDSSIILQLN